MFAQIRTNEFQDGRKMNIVVQGHKVVLRFADTPNNEIAELVKRALLDARTPTAGGIS